MPEAHPLPPRSRSWLLAISLTKWNYTLSGLADACAAAGMLTWSLLRPQQPRVLLLVGILALLFYTLVEYLWHRFLFHWPHSLLAARQGHARHHVAPREPLALPFVIALPHAAVVWGLASVAGLGPSLGAFFTGVYFAGYVTYTCLHHAIHDESITHPALAWLRSVHHVHHAQPTRNFGVTSPHWDIVFGTWLAPKR